MERRKNSSDTQPCPQFLDSSSNYWSFEQLLKWNVRSLEEKSLFNCETWFYKRGQKTKRPESRFDIQIQTSLTCSAVKVHSFPLTCTAVFTPVHTDSIQTVFNHMILKFMSLIWSWCDSEHWGTDYPSCTVVYIVPFCSIILVYFILFLLRMYINYTADTVPAHHHLSITTCPSSPVHPHCWGYWLYCKNSISILFTSLLQLTVLI